MEKRYCIIISSASRVKFYEILNVSISTDEIM